MFCRGDLFLAIFGLTMIGLCGFFVLSFLGLLEQILDHLELNGFIAFWNLLGVFSPHHCKHQSIPLLFWTMTGTSL